jgi:protein-S-isoprenylcysteine O-methyltransferase Ste14
LSLTNDPKHQSVPNLLPPLKDRTSGTITLKQDHELIRTEPYGWVRHPIYTGLPLAFFGSAVALGEWHGLAAVGVAIVAFMLKIRLEERWIIEVFGDTYRLYRSEVRALIPFVL